VQTCALPISNYIYHYIYRDLPIAIGIGNNRLVYADLNNNGTIEPATEIVEENNYYPFGLKHQGYNELPGDGYKYKFLNKEYESSFGLNVTETDFRQYDAALGRFNVMDALSELAPNYTPYRYGFNNPVFWQDATGLFETYGQAMKFLEDNNLNGKISFLDDDDPSQGFTVTVIGGEFDGTTFYNFSELLPDVIVGSDGDGSGGGSDSGSASNSKGSDHKGLQFTEFAYSVAGAYGEAAGKSGKYTQTNGNTGNFNDRSYNRLSKNAKAHYNFTKNLRFLKKA